MKWVRSSAKIPTKHPVDSKHFCSILEYNVLQPSPLNEKVLKEKRKKLKETLDRVMRLYVSLFVTFNDQKFLLFFVLAY